VIRFASAEGIASVSTFVHLMMGYRSANLPNMSQKSERVFSAMILVEMATLPDRTMLRPWIRINGLRMVGRF
jgi:hypothetical protein